MEKQNETSPVIAYRAKLSDFQQLTDNPNAHSSERNDYLMDTSLEQVGYLDSMTASEDGVLLSGNKRAEKSFEKFGDDVIVIETDGTVPIVHKRTDVQSDSPTAKLAAVAANRVGEYVTWDADVLDKLSQMDMGLDKLFYDWEIDKLLSSGQSKDVDYEKEWQGMPEFAQEDKSGYHKLTMHFLSEEDMQTFAQLIGQAITTKTHYLYHPAQIKDNLLNYRVNDES